MRIRRFFTTYFLFVALFVLQKPIFMIFYHELFLGDYLRVMWHGLPLDLSMAGYLTIIPGLLLIISVWSDALVIKQVRQVYFALIAIIMAGIFVGDIVLYDFWGFRLDTTPLFYFFSSPKDALASVSVFFIFVSVVVALLYAAFLYFIFDFIILRRDVKAVTHTRRVTISVFLLLMTVALIIPIRGGFSVSTMNLSKVYFSKNQRMNHAAINPLFSFMSSVGEQNNFENQYRFMDSEDADRLFAQMVEVPVTDTIPQILNTTRPNIIFVILESFSTHVMSSFGGVSNVAVNMEQFAKEGIFFTHFYASSWRTDRAMASILSGYPGQPNTSILKYPEKTDRLPSIPRTLLSSGYNLEYYYGGDVTFTNMRSYLVSSGIEKIVCDKDFPMLERTGKWGVQDHLVFQRVMNDIKECRQDEPFFKIIQTSSSHEPFDVPYHKLEDKVLNAFAYADSCVGDFVRQYRETQFWENTLIVLIPDHYSGYPHRMEDPLEGHTIPLIMIGGAVREPCVIDIYASQIDIAATLLAQMGLPHDDFIFSKNILNPRSPHFAFFTRPEYFGMATPENQIVFNLDANAVQRDEGPQKGANLEKGKAFLQKLYDDLAAR